MKIKLFISLFFLCAGGARAASTKIVYQGQLQEQGVPVNGTRSMVFKIFASSTGGTEQWGSGSQSVAVSNGLFRALLEPAGVDWEDSLFIEVTVDGTTLSPREELTASPYAVNSTYLSGKAYTNSGSAPSSPSSGDLWLDTTNDILNVWSGSRWENLRDSSQAGTINTATNPVDWTALKNVPAGFSDGVDNLGGGQPAVNDGGVSVDPAVDTFNFSGPQFAVTSSPAGQANIALNASSATLQGNSFNGANQLVQLDSSARLTIGSGGTPLSFHYSGTASLNFGAAILGCESFTVSVPGAVDGDSVSLGIPAAISSVDPNLTMFTGYVSAADTVTVKRCGTGIGLGNPPAANVRVDVWR